MHSRNSFISALVLGLVSLSMIFSTVHSHSALQFDYHRDAGISHSIQPDNVLCPIDGYLVKADLSEPLDIEPFRHSGERFPILADHQLEAPVLLEAAGRSPPVNC